MLKHVEKDAGPWLHIYISLGFLTQNLGLFGKIILNLNNVTCNATNKDSVCRECDFTVRLLDCIDGSKYLTCECEWVNEWFSPHPFWTVLVLNDDDDVAPKINLCRCICGGMDLNIERGQSLWEELNQQQCLDFLAIVVHLNARTTLIIQEQSHSKILGPSKLITRESMESSPSCAENAAKLLLLGVIGGPMRRTVASYGIALVALISSTNALSKIISRLLGMDIKLLESIVLTRTMKLPLKLSMKMSMNLYFLVIVDVSHLRILMFSNWY